MTTLLIIALLTVASPTVELESIDGQTVTGSLEQLDADGVTLATDSGARVFPIGSVTSLSIRPDTASPPVASRPVMLVGLIDGSRLSATNITIDDKNAHVTFPDGSTWELPDRHVDIVRFERPTEQVAAAWATLIEESADADRIVLRKGASLDFYLGKILRVSESTVDFDLDGETLPVKRSKLFGLIYYRREPDNLAPLVARIECVDGSRWEVASTRLADDTLEWTTPLGHDRRVSLAEIRRIEFSGNQVVYLSDLEPERTEWQPYFGTGDEARSRHGFVRPRSNEHHSDAPLSLDGRTFAKGLSLHSRTEIVYRLPDRFDRLLATAGIDDRRRPAGHVRLLIHGDDRELLDTTVAGNEPSVPIDLNITGVRRIRIVVDYGKNQDVGDHLDLVDARLVPASTEN